MCGRWLRLVALRWAGCVLLALLAVKAQAHPMPQSQMFIDVGDSAVVLELRLPLDRLEVAFGQPLTAQPAQVLSQYGEALIAYLAVHVRVTAPDGRYWWVAPAALTMDTTVVPAAASDGAATAQIPELVARMQVQPPPGAPLRAWTLHYDVITHEIMTHTVMVLLRQDWWAGQLTQPPQLLGVLRNSVQTLAFTPPALADGGYGWLAFGGVLRMGMAHILEGTDHLLFLLTLVLPAPLCVAKGRWAVYRGMRASLRHLAWVVSAFTLGHSLALLVVGLTLPTLPVQAVEVAIAVSILVTAVHGWRPVFPGREPLVALAFGVVHGMAFSDAIAQLGLAPGARLVAIAGFNVGIELMQLALLALVLPWLLVLARQARYTAWRIGGCAFAFFAAAVWLAERLGWKLEPVSTALDYLSTVAPVVYGVLVATALWGVWRLKKTQGERSCAHS